MMLLSGGEDWQMMSFQAPRLGDLNPHGDYSALGTTLAHYIPMSVHHANSDGINPFEMLALKKIFEINGHRNHTSDKPSSMTAIE